MKRAIAISIIWAALAAGQTTLTLVGPSTVRPGFTYAVNVMLSNPPPDLAALQWSAALPPGFQASAWTCVAGAATALAAKELYCNPASTTCLTVGINTNLYASGVVAIYSLAIPADAAPGPVAIPLSGLVGATLAGGNAPLTAGAPYSILVLDPTDLNGDGRTDVQDLQLIIQRILAVGSALTVRDAQIVAKAAL